MSDEPPIDYVVTGGVDDLVKVWELQDDYLVLNHTLEGHSLGVVSVAVSNNGKLCASSSLDSSMRIGDLEKGEKIANVDVGPVDLWTVAFSPDDKFIISGSHVGKITSYSVETSKAEHTYETRGKFTLSIAYYPDYSQVIKNMSNKPTTIVIRSLNQEHFPLKMAKVVMKQLFKFGVRNICEKHNLILVQLTYSPRNEALRKKFGDLQIKYCRLNLESEEELQLFEAAVKLFTFGEEEKDGEEPPKKKKLSSSTEVLASATASTSKQGEAMEEDSIILHPDPDLIGAFEEETQSF